MEFGALELRWKVLVVMGIIFTMISVILAIIFILFFKTDLLEYTTGEEPDISEFDFLFADKTDKTDEIIKNAEGSEESEDSEESNEPEESIQTEESVIIQET